MATVNLGRVGLVLRGEYDASTKYEKLDVVTYQGSSYIAKQATTGNAPTNESFWQLQSEKGEKGDKGDAGGGLTRLDDQTPVTVEGVLAGKNGKLAPADFVPAEILPTNTVAQAGIVAAPTANNANSLWSTDGSGNPAWRYYDYQTKAQIQQLIAEAISESGHASFEKIDHIPTVEEAKDNILYLVYNTKTEHYDIYAKVVNEQGTPDVLLIDDTTVDLSDYVTNEALEAKDYATNTKLDTAITEVNTNLNNKVDKEPGKGLSSNDYTAAEKSKLAGIEANADVNKIESVKLNGTALPIDTQKAVNIDLSDYATDSELSSGLSGKVDKQEGKQLSTEDFTTAYKNKLDGIPEGGGGGEVNIINTVKVNGTPLVPDAEKAVDIEAYNSTNKPEVGGRNLLPGTKDFSGTWNQTSLWQKEDNYNNFDVYSRSDSWSGISQDYNVKNGEKYTFSLFAKADKEFTAYFFTPYWVNGSELSALTKPYLLEIQVTTEWKRYSISFEITRDGIINPRLELPTAGAKLYVCGYKLERGEIATDWTPAPEDLEAKIPTKTSQLENDSKFITQADIPEGASASNTVPKAPAAAGSVGNELAFARGDHAHPIQDYVGSGWQDVGTGKMHTPIYCAFPTITNPEHLLTRVRTDENDSNYPIRAVTIANVVNDKNFSGILPVIKGGTGSSTGIATSSKIGLIKPGTGCEVTSDGTLNVTASGGISEIPVASATTLGGVKVGDNMKVTEDGTLTANLDGYWSNASTLNRLASINLPNIAFMAYNYASGSPGYVLPTSLIASESNLGLIKTGTGLTIDTNGVVSVDSSNFITSSGGTLNDKAEIALGDQATLKVNDYNGDHRLWLEIKPTESNLNDIEFCLGRYIDFRVDNSGTLVIHTSAPFDGFERELHLTGFKAILLNGTPNHRVISSYDYATTSEAGIVKVGSGLSVDGEGTLSVDSQSTTNNFINLKALYVHEAAAPSIDPDVNGFTIYATGIYPSRTSEEADVTTNSVINIDSADVSNVNCYFKATPINTAGTLASEDDAQSFLSGSMEFQFNQSRVTFGNYGSAKIFINTVLKSSVAKTIVELPSYTSTGTTYAALAEILRSAGITRLQCNGLSKQKLDLYG